MTDVSTYVARVPSQHRERPKFRATLEAVLSPITRLQELMAETPRAYDCDEAIGAQLDVVGKWVGIDRYIQSPLTGIYFEWSGQTAVTGWQSGQWKGTYDPTEGISALDDDTYRSLIKLQIMGNLWDGTTDKAYQAWQETFDGSQIVIEDHLDMTISIGIAGRFASASQKALFTEHISPFKPAGVKIDVFFIGTAADAPIFSWGIQSAALGGWGQKAYWAEKYVME